jgi:polysaccharide export outer membrane protein
MMRMFSPLISTVLILAVVSVVTYAEQANSARSSGVTVSSGSEDFVIGPEDVLGILFWREKEISGDVTVRPDGVITLALIGEVRAAGKTPTALAAEITTLAGRYLTEPNVTVTVRQINSRKVYITGEVNAPGAYPLTGPRTIMQAIALAQGVLEYARLDEIVVLRDVGGQMRSYRFNYEDVSKGRKLDQNFELQPGDTIVVP